MNSIFPFFEDSYEESIEDELPLFSEYAYDFKNNTFLKRNGKGYLVYGDEAIKIWIYKALKTDRYKFLAYDDDYGSEVYTLIGRVNDNEIMRSEIERFIIECLMVNPYIVELSDFNFIESKDGKIVHFKVHTIYQDFDYLEPLEGYYG